MDLQTIKNLITPFVIGDDSGLAQYRQMFGYGGDIRADHRRQFTDAALTLFQLLDNKQSRRVGQGLDYPGAGQQCVFLLLEFF